MESGKATVQGKGLQARSLQTQNYFIFYIRTFFLLPLASVAFPQAA